MSFSAIQIFKPLSLHGAGNFDGYPPLLDWKALKTLPPKWVMGYSDISTFLFAYTLITGTASAHGTNYVDLRSNALDPVTARWIDVLQTKYGGQITQSSSTHYQSAWKPELPGFNLDTPSQWKQLGHSEDADTAVSFSGRLIGGCMDTISSLIGTPYAPVASYLEQYCAVEGTIWYLESCEMNAGDIYRHLWQMKQAGWFAGVKGFMIGRPAGCSIQPILILPMPYPLHLGVWMSLYCTMWISAMFRRSSPL